MTTPIRERFMRHVDTSGSCWLWTGARQGEGRRYGQFRAGTKSTDPKLYAHRVAYELFVGPIPEGAHIDHVKARGCQSTLCVRPDHLEPVTRAENYARERLRVCRAGLHDLLDDASAAWDRQGRRRGCVQCSRERSKKRRERLRGSV